MKKICTKGFFIVILAMIFAMFVPSVLPDNMGEGTVEAASIKISAKKATLIKGQTKKLKIKGTSAKATWKSSKKSVATVNKNGKITAKKKGTAKITATVKGKKYTCKVTVENPKISKTSMKLCKGEAVTLKMKGTSQTVKWSSSKKSVAKVNSSGKVTAKKKGTATIKAKVNGKTYKCKVTVTNTPKITVTPKTKVTSSAKTSFKFTIKNNGSSSIKVCNDMLVYDAGTVYTYESSGWKKSSYMSNNPDVAIPFGDEGSTTIKSGKSKTITISSSDYKFTGDDTTNFTLMFDIGDVRYTYQLYPNTGEGYWDN